jgi:hypothetical protein
MMNNIYPYLRRIFQLFLNVEIDFKVSGISGYYKNEIEVTWQKNIYS